MEQRATKKTWLLVLACAVAAVLAAGMLTACGGSSDSSSSSTSTTSTTSDTTTSTAEGTDFIVGFDQEYPPYGFIGDDGEYTGFDLDLAKEVCERNGWNFVASPINWDAKDMELESGSITCIWNGFTMEGREDDYTFSEPYMLNAQVVVVRADSGITSLDDLAGKTVTTQVDSAAEEVLNGDMADLAATFGSLDTISDYNTAFMDLESGGVDAVACDLSIAEYQMSAKPGEYVMLDDYLSEEHYAVGFKLGNQEMADQVTETLREMTEDGTVEQLCEKYADYGISYDNWVLA